MEEFEFIDQLLKPLSHNKNSKNNSSNPSLDLEDDVALIDNLSSKKLVVSKDIMVENVHFIKEDGARRIAAKLLLSNLSDIAASGSKPIYYMLGFSKNNLLDKKFYQEFVDSLKEIQQKYNIILIGGDTVNSPHIFFSITIFAEIAKKQKILLRSAAKKNDLIFVTNYIGDAFIGLNLKLKQLNSIKKNTSPKWHKALIDKHYFPQPRIKLAQQLVHKKISKCATDISDGLIADLTNICNSSKLDAQIFLSSIPISLGAKKYLKSSEEFTKIDLITGGDDYELIFTSSPKNLNKINKLALELNLKITQIGKFLEPAKLSKKNDKKKYNVFLYNDEYDCHKDHHIIIKNKGYNHE